MNPYTHRFRQESLKVAAQVVAGALVVALLVVLWRTPDSEGTAAIAPIDVEMATWTNGERRWNRVAVIPIDGDLAAQAQLQATRMAACQCLYHSPHGEMSWWQERGWNEVAENVGYSSGSDIGHLFLVHVAFVASPGHRDNMLEPTHRGVGLAVRYSSDGRMWVAQFYGGGF